MLHGAVQTLSCKRVPKVPAILYAKGCPNSNQPPPPGFAICPRIPRFSRGRLIGNLPKNPSIPNKTNKHVLRAVMSRFSHLLHAPHYADLGVAIGIVMVTLFLRMPRISERLFRLLALRPVELPPVPLFVLPKRMPIIPF